MNDSIFQPNYTITPEIKYRLDNIDRNRWLIDNMLLMPKHQAWLHREVRVSRAVGTTRIEGAKLGEEEVARLESQAISRSDVADEQENINALQAYEFIDFISDQPDIPIDELVIRQINRHFIANAAAPLTPGVYRKGHNSIGSFQPPDQGDVPALMRSFALWLRKDDDELNPVLKAGIAHLHLVAIHPFWDGNGRTSRGLETLMLQRSAFGFKKLLTAEVGLSTIRDQYFEALRKTLGPQLELNYDATHWLEFSTMMVEIESARLVAKMTDWHRMMESMYESGSRAGLSTRQMDGQMFALQSGKITRGDYLEIAGVSAATASRDLAEMVAKGLLTMEGKTRSRVYRPVPFEERKEPTVPSEQLPLISDTQY